jgi:hypothetical protein
VTPLVRPLLVTWTSDSRGESPSHESCPALLSLGAEERPLIPWRARCAKCRCNGVCLAGGRGSILARGDCGDCGGGVNMFLPSCRGGITKVGRCVEEVDKDR